MTKTARRHRKTTKPLRVFFPCGLYVNRSPNKRTFAERLPGGSVNETTIPRAPTAKDIRGAVHRPAGRLGVAEFRLFASASFPLVHEPDHKGVLLRRPSTRNILTATTDPLRIVV